MSDGNFYSLEGPLDSMPVERQIRAGNLAGFGELVRRRGADPREIFERHGIDLRAMRDPDLYIDSKALVELLEHCSLSFNDPLFGLRLAQAQEPDLFGSVAALCRSAATFREALRSFIDFIPVVHCPMVVLELVEGRETAELRWHVQADLGHTDQAQYKGALMNLKLLRQIGGQSFRPSYVNLTVDARHRDLPEIASQFGCSFRGRMDSNVIAFPAAVMDHSVPSANRLLFKLLGGYLDRVRAASRRSVVERVEDYVRGSLSSGRCSIEHCAGKMGTSVRTLQATLSEHGLRFSDILERQRMELAKTYLERGDMTLDDMAAMLGYSEQSSFGRAFKRWTGATPLRFQRQLEVPMAVPPVHARQRHNVAATARSGRQLAANQ
ncbi:MAG TPA: AraC family transcriptional regulator ligand-binding domain-containing protein [Solimonas sp.]|nr:AraC family transcriptional regulator ligand-binding domain-containing protein [Solimonas sp.]